MLLEGRTGFIQMNKLSNRKVARIDSKHISEVVHDIIFTMVNSVVFPYHSE